MRRRYWPSPCLRLTAPLLLLAASLIGCSHTEPPARPLIPPLRAGSAAHVGISAVQSAPAYRDAVRLFACHDPRAALACIDGLAASPRFQHDSGAQDFLARQSRICRHALDPRVALDPPPVIPNPPPAAPRRADCGPRALLLVCRQLGVRADLGDLRRQAGTTARGTTMAGLARAARAHGFQAKGVQVDPQALSQLDRPALAWVESDHYLAVLSVRDGLATIHDPNTNREEVIPTRDLWSRCGGVLLTLARP